MTLMPISLSIDITSSICSELTWSGGRTGVELVVGDVPTCPGLGDHLLDGGLAHVEPDICLFTFRLAIVGVLGHRQYPFVLGANRGVRIASPLHLQPYLARISDSHRPSSAFLRLPGLV
jgi:hypothetical protein